MISVILADDSQLVRAGLRALLEREGDFSVLAECSDGEEAVDLVHKNKPQLLLLEMLLPRLHGLEVLRKIKEIRETKAVFVSAHSNATYVIEALKSGAVGYVLKDGPAEEFTNAARAAAKGEHFLTRAIRNCTIEATIGRLNIGRENGHEKLTMRERVVLELAAEGLTNGEIANRLSISRRTVESHRASLMQKMGLKTQTELVRFAIRHNIITA
jgi:two-component system, NarL family, response regulator NreC